MEDAKLIKMAEQICANLAWGDDEDVVVARVADHLLRFWDPRMQEQLIALAKEDGESVSPTLRAAARQLDQTRMPD